MKKDSTYSDFQKTAEKLLIRHKSILDATSKMQEYSARVNRAIFKSVTTCGCIKINADKQCFPPDTSYSNMVDFIQSHISGELCDACRDTIAHEIGSTVFYLAALCNLLDMDIEEAIEKEKERIQTLGVYSLR